MKTQRYISVFALTVAAAAFAQQPVGTDPDPGVTLNGPRGLPAQDLLNMKGGDRPTPLKEVTIEQRLDAQLPLDATFKDETGQTVPLGKYFTGKKPVVLALVYYECPMLCTQILNGLVRSAKVLTFTPGKDYEVVALSFDARETPPEAAANFANTNGFRAPGTNAAPASANMASAACSLSSPDVTDPRMIADRLAPVGGEVGRNGSFERARRERRTRSWGCATRRGFGGAPTSRWAAATTGAPRWMHGIAERGGGMDGRQCAR